MLEAALTLAFIALCIHLMPKMPVFRVPGVRVEVFKVLFGVKLLAGLALVWIYTAVYTDRAYADIFRYFDDSAVIADAFTIKPWDFFRMLSGYDGDAPELSVYYERMHNWYNTELVFKDTRTMIRFSALLRLFTMNTYLPQVVVICFLSTIGLTGIFRFMRRHAPGRDLLLLVVLFLTPSVLLWTSGLIKEAFLFFAIGIALYQLESWKQRPGQPLVKVLSLVLAVFILLSIKAYVFFLLFPFVLGPYTAQRSGVRFQFLTNLLVFLGWLLLLAGITPLVTGASLPELLAAKREEFIRLAHEVHAGSLIPLQAFRADWLGLIAEMPSALFRALLYPLPNQVTGILGALSALENGLMLTFILFMLSSRRKSPTSLNAYSWSALYLSIALMVLASLVTPVVGALVRYKVPALPFFLFYFGSMACSPAMDLPARWKSPPEK